MISIFQFLEEEINKKSVVTRHPFVRLYLSFYENFDFSDARKRDEFTLMAVMIKAKFTDELDRKSFRPREGYDVSFRQFLKYISRTDVISWFEKKTQRDFQNLNEKINIYDGLRAFTR